MAPPGTARAKKSTDRSARVALGVLGESIGYQLRRAQLAVFGDLLESLAPLELRPAQFSVLAIIDANPELTQSDICSALGIQRANFVTMLHDMQARGLTKRRASALDRRVNTLELTPEGRRVLACAGEVHAAHEARLARCIGAAERSRLLGLLASLAALTDGPCT